MSPTIAANQGPVTLKNVASFMAMTKRMIDRGPLMPSLAVYHGPSGYGKSIASIFAQNRTKAHRVEIGDSWTRKTFLAKVCVETGAELPSGKTGQPIRASAAELAERAVAALGEDPARPLIVDEADKAVDKGFIETIRELQEFSGAPVILIGEEKLPQKLLGYERVHNRVLDWFAAQPCDLEDAQLLAQAFAPKIRIVDDLLDHVRSLSGGRARRIVVNINLVAELARNRNLKTVDLAAWAGKPLYTGEPPHARPAETFKPRRAA